MIGMWGERSTPGLRAHLVRFGLPRVRRASLAALGLCGSLGVIACDGDDGGPGPEALHDTSSDAFDGPGLDARPEADSDTLAEDLMPDAPDGEVTLDVDADDAGGHPCPEWARAPEESRLWGPGDTAPIALRLPTPDGVAVSVSQGNDGDFSHVGDQRFAWDFAMPFGSPVHAAATGVAVWVEDGRVGAGPGPEWRELANFIVLDHGGGLFTSYVHLAFGSARVLPGDVVQAGEILAETGESGQLTGPHLHFQVENVWSESIPAAFATPSSCSWVPVQGERVVAQALALADEVAPSALPPTTFAEDGVVDVVGLPARLFSRESPYPLRGRAPARSATEVYFLVLPAEGGTALFAQRFVVAQNRWFEGALDLSTVAPGQYGVALVAGSGQAVRVPRSVRAAIIE
jgi:hypothetical protein